MWRWVHLPHGPQLSGWDGNLDALTSQGFCCAMACDLQLSALLPSEDAGRGDWRNVGKGNRQNTAQQPGKKNHDNHLCAVAYQTSKCLGSTLPHPQTSKLVLSIIPVHQVAVIASPPSSGGGSISQQLNPIIFMKYWKPNTQAEPP